MLASGVCAQRDSVEQGGSVSEDDYIEKRLIDQINWYDGKSSAAQKMFKRLRRVEIVLAAIIPVLGSFSALAASSNTSNAYIAIVMGILGAGVVLVASFISLGRYQENWAQYRTTCEALIHEKYRYLTKAEPYSGENAFSLLVERVESLISKENSEWSQAVHSTDKPQPGASS